MALTEAFRRAGARKTGLNTAAPPGIRPLILQILKEPLVHFIVLGAGFFVLWLALGDRYAAAPDHILISSGQMARSIEAFSRTHLRPPEKDELQNLVDQEIRDEVYFREGMALGLDRDDEIIRRRIRQKVQFLTQDIADQTVPNDADLQKYLDRHRQNYSGEPSYVFSQIYLNPDLHKDVRADARRLLDHLNQSDGRIDYAALGDTLPFSNDFEATPLHVIADDFGHAFASGFSGLPEGRWTGPVASSFGLHLVLIRQHVDAKTPVLADVREAVLRDWQADRRASVNEEAYRQMRARYKVRVDLPGGSLPAPVATPEGTE